MTDSPDRSEPPPPDDSRRDWNVIALRSRWKPTKERLVREGEHEDVRIRIHRACSWIQRVEELQELDPERAADAILVFQWIALNGLYGQETGGGAEPRGDIDSLRRFIDQLLPLDQDDRVQGILEARRALVLELLGDEFLTRFFWRDPGEERAHKARRARHRAPGWYVQGATKLILDAVLERIYLLRCQLVHGAATYGGALNRDSIELCSRALGALLPAFLLVVIDHGHEQDWGPLPYPPVR